MTRDLADRLVEFVTAATAGPWPGMAGQALRLVEDVRRAASAPRPAGPAPRRERPRGGVDKSGLPFAVRHTPTRRERNAAERTPKVRGIRFRVFERCRAWFGNRCEWCRTGEPVSMHHVFKGSERRLLEDDATAAALCEDCDARTEHQEGGSGGPAWARHAALEWARRCADAARQHGDAELAARFLETARILEGKIALARAQEGPTP